MSIEELNKYLAKLQGDGLFEKYDSESDTVMVKFCGGTGGPYDDGEIELTFLDVDVINLPLTMILPAQVKLASEGEFEKTIGNNYRWSDRKLFLITDDVGFCWHIYAGSYSVNLLPVFWERP
jgi:hypothetical protein